MGRIIGQCLEDKGRTKRRAFMLKVDKDLHTVVPCSEYW